ncbi:hypothetical protein NP493_100g00008 [Ridgeia piscesae]|uniref:Uncharacterized protein n=1 Tax=Ridgeia piscesae TaxID=27915 RepID=A0AAD9P800_RIDPI|nr:hypothetical protein NP493_100g00008 [Ridgeia piscesae]
MSTQVEFVCCLEKAGLPDRADRCLHELGLTKTAVSDTMLGISVCSTVVYVRFACRLEVRPKQNDLKMETVRLGHAKCHPH